MVCWGRQRGKWTRAVLLAGALGIAACGGNGVTGHFNSTQDAANALCKSTHTCGQVQQAPPLQAPPLTTSTAVSPTMLSAYACVVGRTNAGAPDYGQTQAAIGFCAVAWGVDPQALAALVNG